MLSVGLGQVVAGVLIMNIALQVVPAGRSSVLYYTMPLWVALILASRTGSGRPGSRSSGWSSASPGSSPC